MYSSIIIYIILSKQDYFVFDESYIDLPLYISMVIYKSSWTKSISFATNIDSPIYI